MDGTPRRSRCSERSRKKRSTMFSQDALVGVEVHMKARVALQPVDDFLMFVRGVVVANDMDLFVFRHGTFDLIEKPDPFLMTMLRHTGPR